MHISAVQSTNIFQLILVFKSNPTENKTLVSSKLHYAQRKALVQAFSMFLKTVQANFSTPPCLLNKCHTANILLKTPHNATVNRFPMIST